MLPTFANISGKTQPERLCIDAARISKQTGQFPLNKTTSGKTTYKT